MTSSRKTDWRSVGAAWTAIEAEIGRFDFAFTDENARRMAALVDDLLEVTSADDASIGVLRLLDVVTEWLEAYEEAHVPMGASDPAELLKHLMEANDLRQKDLADILGGQSVVSAILAGRRTINGRQAAALGERFKLSPAAFLPRAVPSRSAGTFGILSGIDLTDATEAISIEKRSVVENTFTWQDFGVAPGESSLVTTQ